MLTALHFVSKALDDKPLSLTRSTQSWGTYLSIFKPRLGYHFALYTIIGSSSLDFSNYKHSECFSLQGWHFPFFHSADIDFPRITCKMRDDTRCSRLCFSLIYISSFQRPILTINWSGRSGTRSWGRVAKHILVVDYLLFRPKSQVLGKFQNSNPVYDNTRNDLFDSCLRYH
jgi:hypothetical protein